MAPTSGMGLFYIRVNVKALVTGSITKWSPNSTSWHDQDQDLSTVLHNGNAFTFGGLLQAMQTIWFISNTWCVSQSITGTVGTGYTDPNCMNPDTLLESPIPKIKQVSPVRLHTSEMGLCTSQLSAQTSSPRHTA